LRTEGSSSMIEITGESIIQARSPHKR